MDNYVKTFEQFKAKLNESSDNEDDKQYELTVKFTGLYKEDFDQLQKMFSYMNWCAEAGAGRGMNVYCDGDGNFRAKIEMDPQPDKEELDKLFDGEEDRSKKVSIDLGC